MPIVIPLVIRSTGRSVSKRERRVAVGRRRDALALDQGEDPIGHEGDGEDGERLDQGVVEREIDGEHAAGPGPPQQHHDREEFSRPGTPPESGLVRAAFDAIKPPEVQGATVPIARRHLGQSLKRVGSDVTPSGAGGWADAAGDAANSRRTASVTALTSASNCRSDKPEAGAAGARPAIDLVRLHRRRSGQPIGESRVMIDAAEAVRTQVDRRRAETIGFLQELIRLTPKGEAAVQERVARELKSLGCEVATLRYRPDDVPMKDEFAAAQAMAHEERASIVARLRGTGGGRSVIFFAHPDGEPVEGTDKWTRDPFAGEIADGRLYGWGVSDDLSGVATFVEAMHALVASGKRPRGDVIVTSTPSKRHARGVAAVLHAGHVADAAVYLHPAESGVGMREIKAFASGLLEFRITIAGRQPDTREPSHTAFAHQAINPIDKALLVHRALSALGEARAKRVHHPALDAAVGRSTNLLVSQIHCGDGTRFGWIHPECLLGCTLAFPPPETLGQVQAEIEACLRDVATSDDWLRMNPPKVEFLAGVTGAEVKTEHPLYKLTSDAIVATTGQPPYVNAMHTSSDIRVPMVQQGIPTVGLGPLGGDLSQNGKTDEWVDVEDYLRGVKVAASIMVGWSG